MSGLIDTSSHLFTLFQHSTEIGILTTNETQ